jgi:hypothetical protein
LSVSAQVVPIISQAVNFQKHLTQKLKDIVLNAQTRTFTMTIKS